MQGEGRELDARAHHQERKGHPDRTSTGYRRKTLGQVRDIERTRHLIDEAGADQDERTAHGTHDEIGKARGQGSAISAQANQRVGGQRGDLQEDEDVEEVSSYRNPEEARNAEEKKGVEEKMALARNPQLAPVQGKEHDHGGERRNQNEHIGIEDIDPVFDPQRSDPPTERVGNGSTSQNTIEQSQCDAQAGPCHENRKNSHQGRLTKQHADRRSHQGNDGL